MNRLRLVAQIFANALARRHAEQALRGKEARLAAGADLAGLGYHFGSSEQYGILFGYRYMDYSFDEKDDRAEVETELILSGGFVGFEFKF